nr:hypothetical protein CFP56_73094 [Quercus suber]
MRRSGKIVRSLLTARGESSCITFLPTLKASRSCRAECSDGASPDCDLCRSRGVTLHYVHDWAPLSLPTTVYTVAINFMCSMDVMFPVS